MSFSYRIFFRPLDFEQTTKKINEGIVLLYLHVCPFGYLNLFQDTNKSIGKPLHIELYPTGCMPWFYTALTFYLFNLYGLWRRIFVLFFLLHFEYLLSLT